MTAGNPTRAEHPVERLFGLLAGVEPYPEGVVPVPERIPGTAFFPGGAGLWDLDDGLPPMPTGGIMVLGHDFYSEAGYRRFLARGGESTKGSTWRNLLKLFARVGIRPQECFFTNAYVGLRAGSANMGRFPGAADAGFVARCRWFLAEQISVQRPRVLLTLGGHVPAFLAPLSDDLVPWRRAGSLTLLDASGVPLIPDARFDFSPGFRAAIVALIHPSLRGPSVRRRRYRGLSGEAAEEAMLGEALRASGLR